MNAQRIKENFALVADHGLEVADYFYADLFFSDVYRTHLRSYLEALLRNVEEWDHSEHDSLPTSRTPLPRPR
jgi:hypothetical protein